MNLANLKVTGDLQQIISIYRQFKHDVFERWCLLKYTEAFQEKEEFLQQIRACVKVTKDSFSAVRVCIGCVVLSRYTVSRVEECSQLLLEIQPPRDKVSTEFVTRYIAKHCDRIRSTSPQFVIDLLAQINEIIRTKKDRHQINYATLILSNLTTYATRAIDPSTNKFYELLQNMFGNSSPDVRIAASAALNKYLTLTRQKQYPRILYNHALHLMKQQTPAKRHGSLLIMVSLIDFFPGLFADQLLDFMAWAVQGLEQNSDRMICNICYKMQLALAPHKLDDLHAIVEESMTVLWENSDNMKNLQEFGNIIAFAMKKVPRILASRGSKLVKLIQTQLSSADVNIHQTGVDILLDFMRKLPNEFEANSNSICDVLLKARYTSSLTSAVRDIVDRYEKIWETLKGEIMTLLDRLLKEDTHNALELISNLPQLPDDYVESLTPIVYNLLGAGDLEVRRMVPAALLQLSKCQNDELVTSLIMKAMTDPNWQMRLAILNAFQDPLPGVLASPKVLENFSVLVRDESFDVKRAALRLLGGLSEMNPAMIYPMFRRILLDTLFICGSVKSMRVKANSTKCLPVIFSTVGPMLPLYVPVFIPIAIEYLQKHLRTSVIKPTGAKVVTPYTHQPMSYGGESAVPQGDSVSRKMKRVEVKTEQTQPCVEDKLTFFERLFSTKIAVNFIKSIGCICRSQFELMRSDIYTIIELLLTMISRAAHKKVLLASLSALDVIICHLGPSETAKIETLNTTLLNLGARLISAKVHTAIFRILGRIGPIQPQFQPKVTESTTKDIDIFDLKIPLDDYYVRVVTSKLFFVLDDTSEAPLHLRSLKALAQVYSRCKPSADARGMFFVYMQRLIAAMKAVPSADERRVFFKIFATIVKCPVEWLQSLAEHLFALIEDLWDTDSRKDVLILIPNLASALGEEFSPFIPRVISMLLDVLEKTADSDDHIAPMVLQTLTELSAFASNFIFIVIRQIVEIINNPETHVNTLTACLDALRSLVQRYNCASYSSLVVRACLQCAETAIFRARVFQVLYSLAVRMGPRFDCYVGVLAENNLMTPEFKKILADKGKYQIAYYSFITVDAPRTVMEDWTPVHGMDENGLFNAIQMPPRNPTSEQLKQWIREFIQAFIDYSPSPAIQSCAGIARQSTLFRRKIFNVAFLSCWTEASDRVQTNIQAAISQALNEPHAPMSVLSALIGLIEFAERARRPISGNTFIRTKCALKAEKATFGLHCALADYDSSPNAVTVLEQLVQLYNQLGMFDESNWISKKMEGRRNRPESIVSKLTKLQKWEKWDEICNMFAEFRRMSIPDRHRTAMIFAQAALHKNKWPEFDTAIQVAGDSIPTHILRFVKAVRLGNSIDDLVESGFRMIGQQGGPLFLHGFSAVAPFIVNAQQLVELREFVAGDCSHWEDRLNATSCAFNTIRPLLAMRIELIGEENSANEKLALVRLARRANEWDTFKQFLTIHFEDEHDNLAVQYEKALLKWRLGKYSEALQDVERLTKPPIPEGTDPEVYARVLLKGATWILQDTETSPLVRIHTMRSLTERALKLRPNHYRTMHLWGWSNMKLFDIKVPEAEQAAIEAIISFAKCTELNDKDIFSDVLQMCSILFRSSMYPGVFNAVAETVKSIDLRRYLKILPQMLVYQTTHTPALHQFGIDIITALLYEYPHNVLFPLLFAEKFSQRGFDISELLKKFTVTHHEFTHSARTIWQSLQATCMTLPIYCAEGINKMYTKVRDRDIDDLPVFVQEMIDRLSKVECEYDRMFLEKFKDSMRSMRAILERYVATKKVDIIAQKWDDFKKWHQAITVSTNSEATLNLKSVAPNLFTVNTNIVAVPNTIEPGKPLITISSFCDEVSIKMTKQRPRKLKIIGSNGNAYKFLLKGKEDLRQDQRVIQFFELVNWIMPSSTPKIILTGVTPLSPWAGLIQWIPRCNTMHELISDFRVMEGKDLDTEFSVMLRATVRDVKSLDLLRPIQRLEALRAVFEETKGNDLRDMMWLKAPDAESWVKHILNFSKTSAVMSIVGYIIGLGDRHPGNLMIQRSSGSVIHIDFGDCFEITKERASLAERIPFRLTRMMVSAFGPCKVEGSFRRTCEETTRSIRDHREAVMAILEIFMREPVTSGGYFDPAHETNVISGSVAISDLIEKSSREETQERLTTVMKRMSEKIHGMDFENTEPLTVAQQVDNLIRTAVDDYNLAYLFHGWNPAW